MNDEIQQKYIDLKINGQLFPSWIIANYNKYYIEKDDNDNKNDSATIIL